MKLWLLRPEENLPTDNNPWKPWYDKMFGIVVRAETEDEARELAHAEAGDENRGGFLDRQTKKKREPWKDAKYSTCIELLPDGAPCVVIKDHAAA